MGQKVNPISLRLEKTNKKFDSCWHSDFYYSERLSQDLRVKSYLSALFKQIQCTGDKFSFISLHKKVRLLAGYFDPEESRFYRCHHFELTLVTRDEKKMKKREQEEKKKNRAASAKTRKINSDFYLGIKQKRLARQGDLTLSSTFFSKVTCKLRKPLSKKRVPFMKKMSKSPTRQGLLSRLKGKSLLSLISTCNPFLPPKRKLLSLGPLETSLLGGENRMADKRFESWRKRFFVSSLIFFLFLQKWRHPLNFPLFSETLSSPSTSDTIKLSSRELFTSEEKKVSEKKGRGKREETSLLHSKPLIGEEKKEIPFFKGSKEGVAFPISNRLLPFADRRGSPQQNWGYEPSFLEEFLAKNNFSRRVFIWGLQGVQETVNRISKTRNWIPKTKNQIPKTGEKEYISNLKEVLRKELNSDVDFLPYRGKSENQSASFLAQEVVYYLQRRIPFRRFKYRLLGEIQLKRADEWKKIKGFRISCSGRVGGRSKKTRRARQESFQWGQTSLHVFSSKLSFAYKNGLTRFGQVGVKVWICYK